MRGWDAATIARLTGAELLREGAPQGPARGAIDSRDVGAEALFFGLPGEHLDGGAFAVQALAGGAWGALVAPAHATAAQRQGERGALLAHPDPLAALHALAAAWRAQLVAFGARVVAVTGSTGKTSTKDILAAMLGATMATAASPANHNTEIGMPLAILAAPAETRALVLEMAMRGRGQIAELTAIADPDVGVIVNVGPAHLELLGSIEEIAAAKAELIAGMRAGTTAVLPSDEPLLAPHIRADLRTVSFGEGGDVRLVQARADGTVEIDDRGERIELRPSFKQAHNLHNLLAAVAATRALGHTPGGELEVEFSAMRGQRGELPGEVLLIDDCYNANPMSMRAAIDDLAATPAKRRVAVLGEMLELGRQGPRLHREIGEHAREREVELLVGVGPLAAEIAAAYGEPSLALTDAAEAAVELPGLLRAGDAVLVKGSRGVGLEAVSRALREGPTQARAAAERS